MTQRPKNNLCQHGSLGLPDLPLLAAEAMNVKS